MEKKYIYKDSLVSDSLRLQIKDVDGKKGIVTGYFSDFNSIDSDGDIIKPGAFQKSISQNGPQSSKPRIKHLLNHDSSKPLGVLEVLKEDTKGLYYESRLGTHSLGVDFIKMVDSGLISEHSIGFQTVKYNQLKPWNEWKQGEAARELTELKLYEGSSLTAWGANMNTPLTGLKTEQKVRKINDRIDILIKSLRDGTFSDETFDLLEIELKQMQQAMIDLTTEPEQTTQPDEEKAVADIKQFLKTLN
ncbi:MAG TPA: HK97 family phage prohead protease [Spirochaetota bacterium]|nr:HK97 family phage prohead protease [Spirochaetota bacterium]